MGDCAEIEDDPLPATAQVASQQGAYLAKRLNALAKGKQSVADKPFHFKFLGLMTYIGSYKSIMVHLYIVTCLDEHIFTIKIRIHHLLKDQGLLNG